MRSVDTADHRHSSPEVLVEALRRDDALALAEVCSRTVPAAHAVARRLLPRADVEPLLRDLYATLWTQPPSDAGLECWVRQRCFQASTALLRESGVAPVSPSAHWLLEDLPPPPMAFLDGTEQELADLDRDAALALLRAHDAGMPTGGGTEGLMATRALLALAESDADLPPEAASGGDWVFGLLAPKQASETAAALEQSGPDLVRALRRGRRRLEGLPPGPDLAPRLVAFALSRAPADVAVTLSEEEDTELTVALTAASMAVDGRGGAPGPASTAAVTRAAAGVEGVPAGAAAPGDGAIDAEQDEPHQIRGPAAPDNGTAPVEDLDEFWPGEPVTLDEDGQDEEELAARRPRKLLWALAWLAAVGAAIGVGMLIGRLLLDFGVL